MEDGSKSMEIDIKRFITEGNINILQFINIIEYFSFMKQNRDINNDELVVALANNLALLPNAYKIFSDIMKNNKNYNDETLKKILSSELNKVKSIEDIQSYKDIEQYGFVKTIQGGYKSPFQELSSMIKLKKFQLAGFLKTPRGKVGLNPNVFVDYLLTKVTIVSLNNQVFAVYNNEGYYDIVDEIIVAKIVMYVMNDVKKDIWCTKFEKEVLRALQLKVGMVPNMNPNRDYINLKNGMLDLNTMSVVPHSSKFYSTIRIDAKYVKDVKYPRFRQFMKEITSNDDSLEMVLQEVLGYALTAETKAEKAFFLCGTGANGKSVFAKVISLLVGKQNITNIPLRQFTSQFGLETLIDKTVNISPENEFYDKSMNTEILKTIISGDPLHISMKYKKGMDYTPVAKLIFLLNTIPSTSDNSYGFYRKIMIIPFNAQFIEDRADKNLITKLQDELDGILIYALEGLKRLKNNEFVFTKSSAIEDIMNKYEKEQNPVILFLDEALEVAEGQSASKREVIDAFKVWALNNGRDDATKISNMEFWKLFKLALAKKGLAYDEKKVQGYYHLRNLRLNEICTQDEELEIVI